MSSLLARFHATIRSATPNEIRADVSLTGQLELERSGSLSVCYAPFDYVQKSARIVLLGITPGAQQAANALIEARRCLLAGQSDSQALEAAKSFASFSGPMRSNLIQILDHIGINSLIGIHSTASLWSKDNKLVHFTSALRYPTFQNGSNYSGQPRIAATPLLISQMQRFLSDEASTLNQAVWIPLGPVACDAAEWLVANGRLERDTVLFGLPHPSGANAERISYFLGRKERSLLSAKTNPERLDYLKEQLVAQVAKLRG